jgi:NAD(P)H-quinone oxidoreductase subunit 5
MATLAIIGGFTAVFAGLVMMTQANIKRALGYSTVAQMGFMMLQCGLGAFSAAMLHIIAHSLYKAHAFLRTGDAWRVEQIPSLPTTNSNRLAADGRGINRRHLVLGFAVLIAGGVVALIAGALDADLTAKAGGIALISILCLAFASWFAQAYQISWRAVGITSLVAVLLITAYFISYSVVHYLTEAHLPTGVNGALASWVGITLVALFAGLTVLQSLLPEATRRRWLQVLYVHVSNGFYVDTVIRRALGLSLSRTPSAS